MQIVYGFLWFLSGILFLASLAALLFGGGCVILATMAGLPASDDFVTIIGLAVAAIAVLAGSFRGCQIFWRRMNAGSAEGGPTH